VKFSIVTPSFRNSDWLKLCVASVADQAGVEVEHIVQDALSDACWEVIPKQDDKKRGPFLPRALGCPSPHVSLRGQQERAHRHHAMRPKLSVADCGFLVLVNRRGPPEAIKIRIRGQGM
jgi:glycosyltransferase involved in cell wall biosynthesis